MASTANWSWQDGCENDIHALLTFAGLDPAAYIRGFGVVARTLFDCGEKTLDWNAMCSVLVYIHRHSVGLKLKQLTISAAKLLRRPLTLNHVRTIDGFSIAQLWPNLAVMLEQIEASGLAEKPPECHDIELRLRLLGRYDADLCALRSITGLPLRKPGEAPLAGMEMLVPAPQIELIAMLESLSELLLHIERWIQNHFPQEQELDGNHAT